MITFDLRGVPAFRLHSPRWATTPTSGAGAGKHGGRANRIGVDALYLALELETAVAEYQQVSPLLPPGTIVSYNITAVPVVDFRGGFNDSWDPLWRDFFCEWRTLWFGQGIEPPSWVLGDMVIASGAKGLLFSSFIKPGGCNLVLYDDQLAASDVVEVYDPHGDLPKNQDSWPTR